MSPGLSAKLDFVVANTRLIARLSAEIRLWLADEVESTLAEDRGRARRHALPSPFWAIAWARPAARRYALDSRALLACFVSGSGLVANCGALAGAAKTDASDLEEFAAAAIGVNATERTR